MSDHDEHDDRTRDLKIARNEASRELASDMRLSVWAISAAAVLGLVILAFFLMVN
ncbi:MAG: hypothetical protein V4661_00110 [Pseudomonadota bacterium]